MVVLISHQRETSWTLKASRPSPILLSPSSRNSHETRPTLMYLRLGALTLFCRYPKICVFLTGYRVALHTQYTRTPLSTILLSSRSAPRNQDLPFSVRMPSDTPCSGVDCRGLNVKTSSRLPILTALSYCLFSLLGGLGLMWLSHWCSRGFWGVFRIIRARDGDFSTTRSCHTFPVRVHISFEIV